MIKSDSTDFYIVTQEIYLKKCFFFNVLFIKGILAEKQTNIYNSFHKY